MPRMTGFTQPEIRQFFKTARRVARHPELVVLVAATTQEKGRILVVTPRRVGNAVVRNKIKRRLKSLFHEENLGSHGVDCAVIVKPGAGNLTFEQLKKIMHEAFARIA